MTPEMINRAMPALIASTTEQIDTLRIGEDFVMEEVLTRFTLDVAWFWVSFTFFFFVPFLVALRNYSFAPTSFYAVLPFRLPVTIIGRTRFEESIHSTSRERLDRGYPQSNHEHLPHAHQIQEGW
jgi:hypothetical protein